MAKYSGVTRWCFWEVRYCRKPLAIVRRRPRTVQSHLQMGSVPLQTCHGCFSMIYPGQLWGRAWAGAVHAAQSCRSGPFGWRSRSSSSGWGVSLGSRQSRCSACAASWLFRAWEAAAKLGLPESEREYIGFVVSAEFWFWVWNSQEKYLSLENKCIISLYVEVKLLGEVVLHGEQIHLYLLILH